jgi:uncharacterized membrane protein
MPWLLLLHIAGLVSWCGILLYLPALLAAGTSPGFAVERLPLTRQLFTLVATPAALLTIVSGTALFLLHNIVGVWLILKLSAVVVMVVCHALCGALILRRERQRGSQPLLPCLALASVSSLSIAMVLWLVLAKPF